jgi:hypothetical protein
MSTPNQDPRTVVRISERFWSDEVGQVAALEGPVPPYDPAYQFSNGKQFVEKDHYQQAAND